jgi:sec-independent protein translocase protein TatA
MMFIMVLALVLFGPKELPQIGRKVGKAIREFQRASSELKSTFEREMDNLDRETTESVKEIAAPYQYDAYNYDYSEPGESGSNYEGSYGTESFDNSTALVPATASASATEGAESHVTPEGTIAHGAEMSPATDSSESTHLASAEPAHETPSAVSSTSEHNN